MGLHEAVKKHRGASVLLGVVALLAGVALIVFSQSRPRLAAAPVQNNWFYDLDAGNLVVLKQAPQSKNLVWAFVASCGDCADEGGRFPAYIDRIDPETPSPDGAPPQAAKHAGAFHPGGRETAAANKPLLVAKPGQNPDWVRANSDDGRKLVEEALHCDNGATAHACAPPP